MCHSRVMKPLRFFAQLMVWLRAKKPICSPSTEGELLTSSADTAEKTVRDGRAGFGHGSCVHLLQARVRYLADLLVNEEKRRAAGTDHCNANPV
jgi:hypothetical protein